MAFWAPLVASVLGGLIGSKTSSPKPSLGQQIGSALSQGLIGGIQAGVGERVGSAIGGSPQGFMSGAGGAFAQQQEQAAFRSASATQHENYLSAQEASAVSGKEFQTQLMDTQFRNQLTQQMFQQKHEMDMLDKQLVYGRPDAPPPRTFSGDLAEVGDSMQGYFAPNRKPYKSRDVRTDPFAGMNKLYQ